MSFYIGYRNGTREGRCIAMDDCYHGLVNERDACRVADQLRQELGKEPHIQTVKSRGIRLAKMLRTGK